MTSETSRKHITDKKIEMERDTMTKKPLWTSSNGVWQILEVHKDETMSEVRIENCSTYKRKHVYVEHIKTGDELIAGGTAEENEDNVLEKGLPKYLKEKIIELTVEKRYCNRCSNRVSKSDLSEYAYQCYECDEDLYTIETHIDNRE